MDFNEKLKDYLEEAIPCSSDATCLRELPTVRFLLGLPGRDQVTLFNHLCDLYERKIEDDELDSMLGNWSNNTEYRIRFLFMAIVEQKQPFSERDLIRFAQILKDMYLFNWNSPFGYFAPALKRYESETGEVGPELRAAAEELVFKWGKGQREEQKWSRKLWDVISADEAPPLLMLERNGEVFAAQALDDVEGMPDAERIPWSKLLSHCSASDAGKPNKKWESRARELIGEIGETKFAEQTCVWFPLVDKPAANRTRPDSDEYYLYYESDPRYIVESHLAVLKGLAWCAGLLADNTVTRALGALGMSSYSKISGLGARATRVGNACVWALGNIGSDSAMAQLALMKVKVKFGTAQKSIAKALEKLADALGVTTDELEEMSVPEYGLTDVGSFEQPMGEYTACLHVMGVKATISFLNPNGKPMKSVPAAVKRDFAEDLKDLRGSAKDLDKMLSAQRERLDGLFLLKKEWPLRLWRERYLDHCVVGTIAKRLIWIFTEGDRVNSAIWVDGEMKTVSGEVVEFTGNEKVQIWHPISVEPEEVVRWRAFLFEYLIQQPFKQAHREVYLLTDAEKSTAIYSNRFASHVLKQHQFNSLCAVRGWRNRLRLMVDDEYPPAHKELQAWGLRAEFWIEGIGDDWTEEYVLDSGAFRYLSTDQVRFYPIESQTLYAHSGGGGYGHCAREEDVVEPIAISDVPALVLSEILRDIDLFVGVASVGNDPNWSDVGPEGHFTDYWAHHSFGELGETAETRKSILEALLPRLKIANVTRIDGRFLIVEGKIRTYKIHLGSGNILMEPNDQYLCIVKAPNRGATKETLFLPFEGDEKMATILSKAFLLAADDKIKDSTITSQIVI